MPALGASFGVAAAALAPRLYRATASFVPQQSSTPTAGIGALAAQFGISGNQGGVATPAFYAQLLTSREVLRTLATDTFTVPGSAAHDLPSLLRVKAKVAENLIPVTVEELRKNIVVRTDRSTSIVGVDVDAPDPALAAALANRLVREIGRFDVERRQFQARAERVFAERRLDEARGALAEAEQSNVEYRSRNRVISGSPALEAEAQRRDRMISQRQQYVNQLVDAYERARLEEVRNTPVVTLIDAPQGFVESRSRGFVTKSLAGIFVGSFFAVILIFVREGITLAQASADPAFLEMQAVLASLKRQGDTQ